MSKKSRRRNKILGKTLPSSDEMPGNVAIIRKTGE